jgi:hypothetical protein
MPRIAPVTGKSDVQAEHHHVVDDVVKVFGGVRGPFSILLHSPELAERLLPLVTFNREKNVVEPNCVPSPSSRRFASERRLMYGLPRSAQPAAPACARKSST